MEKLSLEEIDLLDNIYEKIKLRFNSDFLVPILVDLVKEFYLDQWEEEEELEDLEIKDGRFEQEEDKWRITLLSDSFGDQNEINKLTKNDFFKDQKVGPNPKKQLLSIENVSDQNKNLDTSNFNDLEYQNQNIM